MNNKEILNKVDEIIALIKESDDYQKYLSLKKDLNNNSEIKKLINEVKLLQKDVIHHLNKKDLLNKKIKDLESNPLYIEYLNTIKDLNNNYSIIEKTINSHINKLIN